MSKMPYKIVKRFFDIVISFLLLIILLPMFVVIALLIYSQDKEYIFVKNPKRIGLGGKEFFMFKFRTMIPNAYDELQNNPKYADLKKKWLNNSGKIKVDETQMVTKIGRILKKTDMDELPQLINVLKGDMSLIGPRPPYKYELERHFEKYPNDRELVKHIQKIRPGMTGIWQVSGRNDIQMHKRLEMEVNYSMNLNIFMDIKILFKTPNAVLTRKGVYE